MLDGLRELTKPGVLLTGPGPVGIVSADGVQLAADGSIIGTAKKGIHFTTLKRFTAAARDRMSLFAQKGMSLITSAGDFVAQAQRGLMQLAAQGDMTIETVDGVLHVKSKKEIVLNCGGSYIRIAPDGIEMGTRGGVRYRCAKLGKTGPAQMDLGGAAFSPKLVPYTTECEIWRSNANFVEEVAGTPVPASNPQQSQALANSGPVAPASSLDAGSMASAGGGSTRPLEPLTLRQQPSGATALANGGAVNHRLALNDPENESKVRVAPEPIKLETAASCNWQLPDFNVHARLSRETPRYKKHAQSRTELTLDDAKNPIICSGPAETRCRFVYDASNKLLTAKVVILLRPKLLVEMDPSTREPARDKNNDYVVVKYDTYINGANSGKSFSEHGYLLVDRNVDDSYGSNYKAQIESTLNQGNYKLILSGCQKGGACGCRVSVKFCVDIFTINVEAATKIIPDVTIDIFPSVKRADASNWCEVDYANDVFGNLVPAVQQVKAHESGHLFNFPDEYWKNGGFVHAQYVNKDDLTLDFNRGDENARSPQKTWQLESDHSLMGGGCVEARAIIQPYYLDYIRAWFSEHTGKEWRVGYSEPYSVQSSKANPR